MNYKRELVQLDEQNRLQLTREALFHIDVPEGGLVEIFYGDGDLLLSSPAVRCSFCGATEQVEVKGDFLLCTSCIKRLEGPSREFPG